MVTRIPGAEVINIVRPRGEDTDIIGPRGEVTHIIGHRGEVTDIRRPGDIMWLAGNCGDT